MTCVIPPPRLLATYGEAALCSPGERVVTLTLTLTHVPRGQLFKGQGEGWLQATPPWSPLSPPLSPRSGLIFSGKGDLTVPHLPFHSKCLSRVPGWLSW